MRSRTKDSTKVVNITSGYSMTYKYTYTFDTPIEGAKLFSMKIGNYYSNAQVAPIKLAVVLNDANSTVVYILGDGSTFYNVPVTTGLVPFEADLNNLNIKAFYISFKSSANSSVFLYLDDICFKGEVETTLYEEFTLEYGQALPQVSDPSREGYTFSGWDQQLPETMPASDLEFNGSLDINQYTLTMHVDGLEPAEAVLDSLDFENTAGSGDFIDSHWTQEYLTQTGFVATSGQMRSRMIGSTKVVNMCSTGQVPFKYTYTPDSILTGVTSLSLKVSNHFSGAQTIKAIVGVILENDDIVYLMGDGNSNTFVNIPVTAGLVAQSFDNLSNLNIKSLFIVMQSVISGTQYLYVDDIVFTGMTAGETYKVITLDYNSVIPNIADPVQTGYTFSGWEQEIPARMPASDLTINGSMIINQYEAKFFVEEEAAGLDTALLLDFETTAGSGTYSDSHWKQEKYTSSWQTITGQMNSRSKDGTKVVNMTGGYSTTYKYTYTADQVLTNITNFSFKFGNYYNAQPAKAKLALVLSDNTVYYLLGSTDTWYDIPVTTGLVPVAFENLPNLNVKGFYISFYSTINGSAYLYVDDFKFESPAEPQPYESFVVTYGEAIPAVTAPEKVGYTFVGWDQAIPSTMPAQNLVFRAQFEINQYTVKFVSDGVTISEEQLDYNSDITYPADPEKVGHTFIGWDSSIDKVPVGGITITAQFEVNQYTVKFVSDGATISEEQLDYNSDITYPADPEKVGHTFTGWDSNVDKVPVDGITITAQFEINQYRVAFKVNDDIIYDEMLNYASTITYPADPQVDGYVFDGWDQQITTVPDHEVVINALMTEIHEYNLALTYFGAETSREKIAAEFLKDFNEFAGTSYTTVAAYWSDSHKASFWRNDEMMFKYLPLWYSIRELAVQQGQTTEYIDYMINGQTIYGYATQNIAVYLLGINPSIWNDTYKATYNGLSSFYTTIDATSAEYSFNMMITEESTFLSNNIPALPSPSREGYTFAGWYEGEELVTTLPERDIELEARYNVQEYTLTFIVEDQVYETLTQNYGTKVTLAAPTKLGHSFTGWDSPVPRYMPAENQEFSGAFTINQYTITLKVNDQVYETITLNYGEEIPAVSDPQVDGYNFLGWEQAIPSTMPAEDMTINANMEVNGYTVSFDAGEGVIPEATFGSLLKHIVATNYISYQSESGSEVSLISKTLTTSKPSWWGYITLKATSISNVYEIVQAVSSLSAVTNDDYDYAIIWHSGLTDASMKTVLNGIVSNSSTYVGKRVLLSELPASATKTCVITADIYSSIEATVIPTVYPINTVTPLPIAERAGYDFVGWKDQNENVMLEISATTTGNLVLTAVYELHAYNITYALDGGELDGTEPTVYHLGDNIVLPTPTKTNSVFQGWLLDNELVTTFDTSLLKDVELTATWQSLVPVAYIDQEGYITINAALEAAQAGDVITVVAGEYDEVLNIAKSISLVGPNTGIKGYEQRNEEAVLKGKITITASGVTLDGFKLENSATITVNGNNATITNIYSAATPVTAYSGRSALLFNTVAISNLTVTNSYFNSGTSGDAINSIASDTLITSFNISNNKFENSDTSSSVYSEAMRINKVAGEIHVNNNDIRHQTDNFIIFIGNSSSSATLVEIKDNRLDGANVATPHTAGVAVRRMPANSTFIFEHNYIYHMAGTLISTTYNNASSQSLIRFNYFETAYKYGGAGVTTYLGNCYKVAQTTATSDYKAYASYDETAMEARYDAWLHPAVAYDLNGGSWNGTEGLTSLTHDVEYVLPENVERLGYNFLGWFVGETKVESCLNDQISVTAHWEEKIYSVSEILTILEAANLASNAFLTTEPLKVKGVVKSFEDGSYIKNLYLQDENNSSLELLVYSISFDADQYGFNHICVNDVITCEGYFKNYQGTLEMASYKDGNNVSHYCYMIARELGQSTVTVEDYDQLNGTVSLAASQLLDNDSQVEFSVAANDGYKVMQVTINGVIATLNANDKYEFVVLGNTTIAISIEEDSKYQLTITDTNNYVTVTPLDQTLNLLAIAPGTEVEFLVEAKAHCEIVSVTVNGVAQLLPLEQDTLTLTINEDTVVEIDAFYSGVTHRGTENDPLTVAEACMIADYAGSTATSERFYVVGAMKNVATAFNADYNNISINLTDGVNIFQLYILTITQEQANGLIAGALIKAEGKIKKYNSTKEFDSGCTFQGMTLPEYDITINDPENGSVQLSHADTIQLNEDLVLTFNPAEGYELYSVLVNGEEKVQLLSGNTITLEDVNGNLNIVVEFSLIPLVPTYAVTFEYTLDDSASYALVDGTLNLSHIDEGTNLQFSVNALANYKVLSVKVGQDVIAPEQGIYSYQVNGDTTITIETFYNVQHAGTADDPFDAADAIVVAKAIGSSETPVKYYISGVVASIATAFNSTYKNISVNLNDGTNNFQIYRVNVASASSLIVGDTITVCASITTYNSTVYETKTIDQSKTVIVTPLVNISVNDFENGSTTLPASAHRAEHVSFTVTANEGYQVSSVTFNGNALALTDGQYSFDVVDPSAIVITIIQIPTTSHNVTLNAEHVSSDDFENGVAEVGEGETFNFSLTADEEYLISKVYANGVEINPTNNTYSIENVMDDVEITVDLITLVMDTLNNGNTINGTGTSYTPWTTSGLNVDYSGQSAGQYTTIQIRSNNNNSGIVSTSEIGNIRKVIIKFNSNTANDRIIDIYGSNDPYSAPTDLYNSNSQGTKLGSATKTSTNEEIVILISGDYKYVGLRSRSGAAWIEYIKLGYQQTALSDAEKVAAAKEALTLSVTQTNEDFVVALEGLHGTTISWDSDNAAVNFSGEDAIVTPGDSEIQVTLTATITLNSESDTKEFNIVVIPLLTEAEKVAADKAALDLENTTVTADFNLPAAGSVHGSVIEWESNNAAIAIEEEGGVITAKVTRPAAEAEDAEVTLTATITKGAASDTKEFVITVSKEEQSGNSEPVTQSVTFSEKGYGNAADVSEVSIDANVSVTFDKGSGSNGPKYYTSGTAIRAYAKNTITVAAAEGKTITSIKITFGSSDGSNDITASCDDFDGSEWTGSANSVVFTIGGTSGNRRIASIEVTYE